MNFKKMSNSDIYSNKSLISKNDENSDYMSECKIFSIIRY